VRGGVGGEEKVPPAASFDHLIESGLKNGEGVGVPGVDARLGRKEGKGRGGGDGWMDGERVKVERE